MKLTRVILALLMALQLSAGIASAQVAEPQNLAPPGQVNPGGLTVPAGGEDDEIVIIQGPKIGKSEKPQLTPQMLEMLYKAIWQKVGKEYQDPYKLNNWASWENKFAGKLKTEEDLDAAVKEMLESLQDRWTVYHSPAEIARQKTEAKEGFIGIGMLLRRHSDSAWHIDGMQFGSPAMKSVLREGDVILAVNGQSLENLSKAEVSKLLSGKEGEKITVKAVYDGGEHEVELTFARPEPNQVAVGLLPGNILYIRLPTFVSEQVVANFVQVLGQAYEGTGGQINGIVFDLRYNGGGLVTMALNISSMFTENGTVTTTNTRQDRSITETRYKVMPLPQYMEARMPKNASEFLHFLQTVPLVILTNGSTASASEITTGALKDNGRAYVIGVKTFGKAVGYTVTPLPNGGAVQVTNLSYLTPNGTNIADRGIEPDLTVEQPRGQEILGEKDEQVKAAHEHLLKIAQERARQLAAAQELSTKAQSAEVPVLASTPFVMHGLYVLFAVMGGALLLTVCVFFISTRQRGN